MIFSRSRGSKGRHHRVDDGRRTRHAEERRAHDQVGSDDGALTPLVTSGPYDVADAPDGVDRLDLGSIQIPVVADVEVRVQAGPDGQVQQVVLVSGDSALQLGAFAAPRTEGIWAEVRDEIRQQLADDGLPTQEIDGPYGPELRAQVRTPEGVTDLRFVGIDGPRWMVRAVYQGPAAVDPDRAGSLSECLSGLVVDRGREAMPVREPLPLQLPREVAQEAAGDAIAVGADGAQPADADPQSEPHSRPQP